MPIEGDLERAGRNLRQARADLESATEAAQRACLLAHNVGTPETTLAFALGVTRQTVRAWLGK